MFIRNVWYIYILIYCSNILMLYIHDILVCICVGLGDIIHNKNKNKIIIVGGISREGIQIKYKNFIFYIIIL